MMRISVRKEQSIWVLLISRSTNCSRGINGKSMNINIGAYFMLLERLESLLLESIIELSQRLICKDF